MTDFMSKIEKAGIYLDFPIADYFADPTPTPSLSQSVAKILIDRSPAHAAAGHPRLAPQLAADEPEEEERYDAAKAIGNAAHALLIGRGKDLAIGAFPDWRKKEAKEFKSACLDAGKTPILEKHHKRAAAMVAAGRRQLDAVGWSVEGDGEGEAVIAWQEDGLWFRSMIDWLGNDGHVYDFKSTSLSCAPHAIPNMMASAGWDIQAAMIERGLAVLTPDMAGRRRFRFIAIENEPPYALTPVELPEAVLTMGRKRLAFAVARWREAVTSGAWPAYPAEVCRPEYPGWQESRWLDREIAESERPKKGAMLESLMGG